MISRVGISIIICSALLVGGCRFVGLGYSREYENLEAAEEYSRKGEFDEAIEAYRRHMRYRLSLTDRPDWENPYLYLLMIGDLHLQQEKPEDARATYELAEKNKVDRALVSDRYRYLASWYEKKGEFDMALQILSHYRDRDELLFDVMRDRLAKELVRREQGEVPLTSSPVAAAAQ